MYNHSLKRLLIGVPGTPLSFIAVAVVGANTCPIGSRGHEAREFAATVAVAITVTAVIARLLWRPDPASATGQVVLGTLTIPVGTPIGSVVRKKFAPTRVGGGGYYVLDVTQAATAGTGYITVEGSEPGDALTPGGIVLESA